MNNRGIVVLAETPALAGRVFERLAGDILRGLGYRGYQGPIPGAGREIDGEAFHRYEPRRAVVECKATAAPIGGKDVTTFIGKLAIERQRYTGITVGYFISAGGFRASARRAAEDAKDRDLVLLEASDITAELISAGVIVAEPLAAEMAGRLRRDALSDGAGLQKSILLCHETGWHWLITYAPSGGPVQAWTVLHADGAVLREQEARPLVLHDGTLASELPAAATYLEDAGEPFLDEQAALAMKYRTYLDQEFGYLSLDGLPAIDAEVTTHRIDLADIYVPARLSPIPLTADDADELSIGMALERGGPQPVVLLGGPGSGKTTLLKTLVTAYAHGVGSAADDLPERDWLPLVIRCRDLGPRARKPLSWIVNAVGEDAELGGDPRALHSLFARNLRGGRALLLVDGLDEIADAGDRQAFVGRLRTFVTRYPRVQTVITSRETGFRDVAPTLDPIAAKFQVRPFDVKQVHDLTTLWHLSVYGDSVDARRDAANLAERICNTPRVFELARTPLLLTTLLLVRRWVGDLPARRSVLYDKAIEVLLWTWNTQGHDPLPVEESVPQLSWIAYSLTSTGDQRLDASRLAELLRDARAALPALLGFARISVEEFVRRVEHRSSLLDLVGHGVVDGRLQPIYEFKHLTFQEFLAAHALVSGCRPDASVKTAAEVVTEVLADPTWEEVIPLAAVRAGMAAEDIVLAALRRAADLWQSSEPGGAPGARVLMRCLADDAQLSRDVLGEVLPWLISHTTLGREDQPLVDALLRSRYGDTLRAEVLVQVQELMPHPGLPSLNWLMMIAIGDARDSDHRLTLAKLLTSNRRLDRVASALIIRDHARSSDSPRPEEIRSLFEMLRSDDLLFRIVSADAIGAFGLRWPPSEDVPTRCALFDLWRTAESAVERSVATTALAGLRMANRRKHRVLGESTDEKAAFVLKQITNVDPAVSDDDRIAAALTCAFYLDGPVSDDDIAATLLRARELVSGPRITALSRTLPGGLMTRYSFGGPSIVHRSRFEPAVSGRTPTTEPQRP